MDHPKTILDLPFNEVVMIHIATRLDMQDLLSMRLASRAFYRLANMILGEFNTLHFGCCEEPMPLPLALLHCRNLRIIHLTFTKRITDRIFAVLLSRNRQIREFRLIGCVSITRNGLDSLLKCQDLTYLEFTTIKLPDSFLKALARSNISLQHVAFKYVYGFLGTSVANFFANQPNLRSIVLRSLMVIVRTSLHEISRVCHQLEELTVQICKGVDDNGLLRIACNCLRIHTLFLSFGPGFIDMDLYPIDPNSRYASVSKQALNYLLSRNIAIFDHEFPEY